MAQIDLDHISEVNLRGPNVRAYQRRRFLDRSGLVLASLVLVIIFIYILFVGFYFYSCSQDPTQVLVDIEKWNKSYDKDMVKQMLEIHSTQLTESRNFVLEISKSILLNLLLPILTAIIGYIFGSGEN